MEKIKSDFSQKIEIITPDDEYHYFFAYYDMRATGDGINQNHLCHRVKFMDRIPTKEDVCEIGYLKDKKFYKIGETTAWNFQQGAMLQYHPFKENTVYYNVVKDGKFVTVTHNFETGEKSYTDMATACVSPNGKYGLSVNYGRIFAFRPGYGYAGCKDEFENVNVPKDDGVFLTDMESGKSKLLVTYEDMLEESGFTSEDKILVNHITFNTTSDRYVMLVRNFPIPGRMWSTSMMIGDLNGNVKTVVKNTYVSHYKWISPNEILVHCNVHKDKEVWNLYVINVDDGSYKEYDSFYYHIKGCSPDIHCTQTPDGKYFIGDGYPFEGYRGILATEIDTLKSKVILWVKTVEPEDGDARCDLHARYVFNGKYVSFDTTMNDKRQIAIFPTEEIKV